MPTHSFPWRSLVLILLPFILQWTISQPNTPPHLSAFSLVPLLYAALTGVGFHFFGLWVFQQDGQEHGPALAARMVAGVVAGVPLVFLLQWSALHSSPSGVFGFGVGDSTVGFFLSLVGWGYRLIDNPLVGFWPALLGYTVSVGLAEESTKAAIARRDFSGSLRDRLACGWAAGVGLGLGEAILYSFRDYNGQVAWPIFLCRFLFCVGLHGCMSATATLMLVDTASSVRRQRVRLYQILLLLPVAFLHGLYDVVLDRSQPEYSVLVAFLICASPAMTLWFYERRAEEGGVD